jgi:peptidoglycan/LPS O-acetylase OafA/YrhL
MQQIHPKYRADIDGLRAIAVLAVVMFHAFPSVFKGGFIGVDIFFVISGYLISSIILTNLRNQSFKFSTFYTRRIKRIFPALVIVLISCHVAGWFLLSPGEYQQLGKHIAGGSSFSSNFILWNESGYFDNSAETKPLLHLWSLGIEEQFYILWPFILWGAFKRQYNFLLVIGSTLAISFALNISNSYQAPIDAFYLPFNRFWEMIIGALVACWTNRNTPSTQQSAPIYSNILSVCGLTLIIIGLNIINKDLSFPGWWALAPCLGTALLILSGPNPWINRHILAQPMLVWIGLISYPLYLWHWPLLTFYRIQSLHEISAIEYAGLILLSLLFAACTYLFIEKIFRHSKSKSIFGILILSAMTIGFIGFNCYLREGMPFRKAAQEKFDFEIQSAYGPTNCFSQFHQNHGSTCSKSINLEDGKNAIFLLGDSHAAHLYQGLISLNPKNYSTLYDGSLSACPPILNFAPRKNQAGAESINEACIQHNLDAHEKIKYYKPRTVILAADWIQYDGFNQFNLLAFNQIENTLRQLKADGVKKIILVGNFPVFYVSQPRLFANLFVPNEKTRTFKRMNLSTLEKNQALKQLAKSNSIDFVSPTDLLCDQDGCLMSTNQERLIPMGIDVSHLSKQGSIFFVNLMERYGRFLSD